jgi:hypothetical protein
MSANTKKARCCARFQFSATSTIVGILQSAETARRLCCDAGIVPIVEDASGQVLDIGRKRRTISVPLRRALQARDRGCRFPGCSNQRFVDAHHVVHWADGGQTRLDNLVSLCRRHHRFVHEHGYSVCTDPEGGFRFADRAGQLVPAAGARPVWPEPDAAWQRLRTAGFAAASPVSAASNLPRWDGLPVPYSNVVTELAQAGKSARSAAP